MRAVTSGRTAKEVSPTRPRVTLVRASWFTGRLRRGATGRLLAVAGWEGKEMYRRSTVDQ